MSAIENAQDTNGLKPNDIIICCLGQVCGDDKDVWLPVVCDGENILASLSNCHNSHVIRRFKLFSKCLGNEGAVVYYRYGRFACHYLYTYKFICVFLFN